MADNEETLQNVVTLMDENGDAVEFDHLMTFEHEGLHYIALLPMDEVEGLEPNEVVLLRVEEKDGEDVYLPVEDEQLLEEAFDTFLAIMDEEEERDAQ